MKRQYQELFDKISEILFRYDLANCLPQYPENIHIKLGLTDEYDQETTIILSGISDCKNKGELTKLMHSIFVKQFNAEIGGDISRYENASQEIWTLFEQKYKNN